MEKEQIVHELALAFARERLHQEAESHGNASNSVLAETFLEDYFDAVVAITKSRNLKTAIGLANDW